MGYFYLFLFTGLFYFFGDVFLSNWDKIPGGIIDGNFINYILEHINLFVTKGNPLHFSLWNMPFFYPMTNTLALSDSMLSVAPLYILIRKFFDVQIAFSLTVMCFTVFNFILFFFVLRRLNFSKLLSSLGAFIYAFSYVNRITMMHVQLIIQFFYLGAVLAMLYVSKHNSQKKNMCLFLTASLMYVLGLYSSFYLGFYVFLICIIAGLVCILNRKYKRILKVFLLRYKKEICISFLFAVVLLLPLIKAYLSTGISRTYEYVLPNLPYFKDLFTGHSFVVKNFIHVMYSYDNIELSLMFTHILLIFGLAGLLRFKRYGLLLFLTFVISCFTIIKFACFGDFSLWKLVYTFVPGAVGIRETVRMILVLNPVLVLGFLKFLSTSKWNKSVLIVISVLVLFEQYLALSYNHRSYSQEMKIQNDLNNVLLPKTCRILDVNFKVNNYNDPYLTIQEDMARVFLMWFASDHGFYFVSGYSGLSEGDGFYNKARDFLKNNPEYCVITKYIKNN